MASKETGRPSAYDEEKTIFMAEDYLENYKDNNELIPSIAGLAMHLGVSRSTVNLWATQPDKSRFSDTLEQIKAKQELLLLNGGLGGVFNPAITKLALANHGYKEKQDINHESQNGSMTPGRIELVVATNDNKED